VLPRFRKLFIHGWATDSRVWDGLTSDGDITITLPGHGAPSKWSSHDLSPAIETIKYALKNPNIDMKKIGIGWSLGGEALMAFTATNPKALDALVLIGASPSFIARKDFTHGQPKSLVRRMLMDLKKNPKETLRRFYQLNFTAEEIESSGAKKFLNLYEKTPSAFDTDSIALALECLINIDIRAELDKIKIPVLLIHGGRDEVCPIEAGQYLADKIENATFVRFNKAGHAPFLTEPERFTAAVEEFLRDI
jgi:pimeloyl-[acyl-carrier protein] methyl ester esterase